VLQKTGKPRAAGRELPRDLSDLILGYVNKRFWRQSDDYGESSA
jgi:hypothetical protein